MDKSIFKIIRKNNDESIEFYANVSLEPNSSLEIENCIRQKLHPISELKYRFDLWFDDNDSGYFIKDSIRVNIHYGVMTDFSFEIDNEYCFPLYINSNSRFVRISTLNFFKLYLFILIF